MGIVINQATWGDESSATNITASLQKQASGGYLDTRASNSLVPAIDLSGSTSTETLTDKDKEDITRQAVSLCASASDQKCIAFQKNQLETALLQQKIAEKQSSANIVTGRRLTLTYTDTGTGVQKTVAIPDGQAVKFGTPPTFQMPSFFGTIFAGVTGATAIVLGLVWAFSVFVTYRVLKSAGHDNVARILTFLAVILPGTGLITTPIALAYLGSPAVAVTKKVVENV
jgi:hypothetical protein